MVRIPYYLYVVFIFTSVQSVVAGTIASQENQEPANLATFSSNNGYILPLKESTSNLYFFDSVEFSLDHFCENLSNRLCDLPPTEKSNSSLLASEREQWSQQPTDKRKLTEVQNNQLARIVSNQQIRRLKLTQKSIEHLKARGLPQPVITALQNMHPPIIFEENVFVEAFIDVMKEDLDKEQIIEYTSIVWESFEQVPFDEGSFKEIPDYTAFKPASKPSETEIKKLSKQDKSLQQLQSSISLYIPVQRLQSSSSLYIDPLQRRQSLTNPKKGSSSRSSPSGTVKKSGPFAELELLFEALGLPRPKTVLLWITLVYLVYALIKRIVGRAA